MKQTMSLPTEQASNDLVVVTHSHVPVLPELVVPSITLHCKQPTKNDT